MVLCEWVNELSIVNALWFVDVWISEIELLKDIFEYKLFGSISYVSGPKF